MCGRRQERCGVVNVMAPMPVNWGLAVGQSGAVSLHSAWVFPPRLAFSGYHTRYCNSRGEFSSRSLAGGGLGESMQIRQTMIPGHKLQDAGQRPVFPGIQMHTRTTQQLTVTQTAVERLRGGFLNRHIASVYATGAGEVNEAIPYSSLGQDIAWIGRVFFNLLA